VTVFEVEGVPMEKRQRPGTSRALSVVVAACAGLALSAVPSWGQLTPQLLKDINPGAADSDPKGMGPCGLYYSRRPFNGSCGLFDLFACGAARTDIYFVADDGVHGRELWKTDWTPEGTVMVRDINPGGGDSNPVVWLRLGEHMLFYVPAQDELTVGALWRTDGTEAGTEVVKEIPPTLYGGHDVRPLLEPVGDIVFFHVNGWQLWRTDGTPDGTFKLLEDPTAYGLGSFIKSWPIINGKPVFPVYRSQDAGQGLWSSDGTVAGTMEFARYFNTNDPLVRSNDFAVFLAWRDETGTELYRTGGPGGGTGLLYEFCPGPDSPVPRSCLLYTSPSPRDRQKSRMPSSA
jgi:ELWxxDGT repeat protein